MNPYRSELQMQTNWSFGTDTMEDLASLRPCDPERSEWVSRVPKHRLQYFLLSAMLTTWEREDTVHASAKAMQSK